MKIRIEQLANWKKQTVEEDLAWAKVHGGLANDIPRMEGYRAGLFNGFENAIKVLELHGFIKRAE